MTSFRDLLSMAIAGTTVPGTLELTALTAAAWIEPEPPGEAVTLVRRMAVVVPAHNEGAGVRRCVASLRKAGPNVLICVVADNCSDDTAEHARGAGADLVLERTDDANRGKGFALEFAFEHLMGAFADLDAFFVVDADSDVEENFFSVAERWFAAGADAVQARYLVRNPNDSTRTALMNVAFMGFNVLRPRGRENLGLSVGILGNGFGLARRTLELVPYTARSVVEDLEYHISLVRAGCRVRFMDTTSVRADFPVGEKGSDTQRARWEGGRIRMMKDFIPSLASEVALGNSRLAEPLFDLCMLPLGSHVAILGGMLLVPFPPTQLYAATSLASVVAHVGSALHIGGAGQNELRALAQVPKYMLWKLGLLKATMKAAESNQEWVRTARASET